MELARSDDEPVDQRHQHTHQHPEQILEERDPGVAADHRQAEAWDDAFAECLNDRGQEDDEAPEDEEMEDARIEIAEHPRMQADVAEDASDPLRYPVEPVFV